jgi:DNA-binding MarR family transcriptional regulator
VERPPDALSPTKVAVLAHLYRRGPSTPSEVADAEHHQAQTLTRVLADLERTGLITRAASDQDKRASILAISGDGAKALERDMAQRDQWLAEALGSLTRTEIELLRLAAELIDRLADAPSTQRAPQAAA